MQRCRPCLSDVGCGSPSNMICCQLEVDNVSDSNQYITGLQIAFEILDLYKHNNNNQYNIIVFLPRKSYKMKEKKNTICFLEGMEHRE